MSSRALYYRTLRSVIACTIASLLTVPHPVAAQVSSTLTLPTRFNLDAAHSSVGFAVRFMGLSTVRGAFSQVSGTIMYYEGQPSRSSVSVRIATASINTNAATRDKHLKSPDFFDVEKFPAITFRSSDVTKTRTGLALKGDLTIHGITKQVTIPFTQLNKPMKDAWGNTRVTFQGGIRIKRQDYGIKGTAFWNSEFDPGRMAVSDDVDIELLVSADVANPLRWTDPVGDSIHATIVKNGIAAALDRLKSTWPGVAHLDSAAEFSFVDVGEKLNAAGRVEDAIRFYEAVVALRPDADVTRFRLGEAYLKVGRQSDAVAAFERVASTNPDFTGTAEWLRVLRQPGRSGGTK